MGYTHYWTFGDFISEKAYKQALKDCRKIIKASPVPLGNGYGEGKPRLNNGIWINGFGDDSFETFALNRTPGWKQDDGAIRKSDFCKTGYRPYDVVVTACLCVLKHYLKDSVTVSSDGDPHEWEDGKKLASKVLNKDIKIPQYVIDQECMVDSYRLQYRKDHPEYVYTGTSQLIEKYALRSAHG